LIYCSAACYNVGKIGAGNPKWKGGQYLCDGYRYIYSPTHPDRTKLGYVAEHRLVMEAHIGRRLKPTEAVHHIDEDRLNNNINNMQLFDGNGMHSISEHIKYRTERGTFTNDVRLASRRFSEEQDQEIMKLKNSGKTAGQIADIMGVQRHVIYTAVRRITKVRKRYGNSAGNYHIKPFGP